MGVLEEMLLRNGLIYRNSDGTSARLEGSILSNSLVVINSNGQVTHRIEKSEKGGGDLVVRNVSTRLVEMRLKGGLF